MAIAERFLAERYNRPHHDVVDRWIYAICSDGDLMEGVSYGGGSLAGHLGLGRLVYFYDDNHITIDGSTALTFAPRTRRSASRRRAGTSSPSTDSEDLAALERAVRDAQAERSGRRS